MMRIIVHHNSVPIKTYQFTTESITVGRLATNSIPINSMGISRHHLKVERDLSNGQMNVEDMGSLNGSFVNNQKITSMQIQSGTDVVLGKYSLHIEFTDHVVPAPGPVIETEAPEMLTEDKQPDGSITSEHAILVSLDEESPEENDSDIPTGDGNFIFTSSANQVKHKASVEAEELDPATVNAVLIDLNRQVIYKINKTKMTFGSDKTADIFVESGVFSSDNLATLTVENDTFTLTKGNGKMKVNDKKTPTHILNHKDKVKIDNSEFSFMIKDN